MKFKLLGKEIEISEGRKNYMNILTYYKTMAAQAERDFKQEYEDAFGLIILSSSYAEKFVNTYASDDYMDKIVQRYVAKTRQYLTNYGVYNLSDSYIWDKGIVTTDRNVSRLQPAFNEFFLDVASDETNDSVIVPQIKSKFNGRFFTSHLYNDIMSLCDFVLNYLDDNKISEIQFVYKQNSEKAAAYFLNLKDTVVTEDDELKALESIIGVDSSKVDAILDQKLQKSNISDSNKEELAYALIDLDPRNESYFEYIFENFESAKYEISAIAQYLSVDLSDLIEKDIRRNFDVKSIS